MASTPEDQITLTVLQRQDSQISSILIRIPWVSLYSFGSPSLGLTNNSDGNWHKLNYEGSLVLVNRKSQPFFQYILLNRKHSGNLIQPISHNDFKLTKSQGSDENVSTDKNSPKSQLVIYRAGGKVLGLWFYQKSDQSRFINVVKGILSQSQQPPNQTSSQQVSTGFPSNSNQVPYVSPVINSKVANTVHITPQNIPPNKMTPMQHTVAATPVRFSWNNSNAAPNVENSPNNQSSSSHQSKQTQPHFYPTSTQPQPSFQSNQHHQPMISQKAVQVNHPGYPSIQPRAAPAGQQPSMTSHLPNQTQPSQLYPQQKPMLSSQQSSTLPAPNQVPVWTRDQIRQNLLALVHNDDFIELIYQQYLGRVNTSFS